MEIQGETSRATAPLPRGPHDLTPDEIAESHRARLKLAMTELIAEKGWGAMTISDLVARAKVSRSAFYDNYDDKLACLLSAYDEFSSRMFAAAALSIGNESTPDEMAKKALSAYLAAVQADTVAARAFMVEMDAAGPVARGRKRETAHVFADVRAGQHQVLMDSDPSLDPLPHSAYLGIALGLRELIREELETNPEGDLSRLTDDVHDWILAMVRGARA